MAHYRISKRRIIKLKFPKGYDVKNIQIGIPVIDKEAMKVGLNNVGDVILPSYKFGPACNRNANGYCYPDKTKPKEERYITTNWIQPFGNEYASSVACDIYKPCYPLIEVPPTEIELTLYENEKSEKYVVALLTEAIRKNHLIESINIFLEIYGECFIFSNEIAIESSNKRHRCNWEILPPGELPSEHLKRQLKREGKNTDTYDVSRLKILEYYNAEQIVEGINGFEGYYAYVFKKYCILESAVYGNATYIIPKENWEIWSQKTKKELLDENVVIEKLVHTANWKWNLDSTINELENQ